MMMSIDGRIDCGMTVKLAGNAECYATLAALDVPTTLSGRRTAQLEMAQGGEFHASNGEPIGREAYSEKTDAAGYNVVVDTKGTLMWPGNDGILVMIVSEQASKEYLDYLDECNISWIACGKERIDLASACEIFADRFGVKRMGIVGGGTINAGFLDTGPLDEVSILIGPGIDGRKGMVATFDGLPENREPFALKLESVTPYDDGAVWLRYSVK